MQFKIYDYQGTAKEVNLNMDDISRIEMYIVSGDEVLYVFNKKGSSVVKFDSDNNSRTVHNFDSKYTVYNAEKGINFIEDEIYNSSSNPYSRCTFATTGVKDDYF